MLKRLSKLCILLSLVLAGCAYATDTTTVADHAWIYWTAPPDTDVVQYRAYVDSADGKGITTFIINRWEHVGETNEERYYYTVRLKPGLYYLQLTAIDRAGNESERSNQAWFRVEDLPPGKPLRVRIVIER